MILSIITINRNNKKGLEKTIQSVINQKFNNYEYIIVDGASTDGSVDVINKYADNITYWISEPDKGIYNAMNKGIKLANGNYCLFLNSGDYFYKDHVLENCFKLQFQEDIVYGHQLKIENGKTIEDLCLDVAYMSFLTLKNSHIPHQCTFIKRDLFNEIGLYSESNKIISDWEFIMKALFVYNKTIRRIPIEMTVYDTEGISSISEYKKLQFEERKHFLNKQFPLFIIDYDYFDRFMNKRYIKLILNLRNFCNKLFK